MSNLAAIITIITTSASKKTAAEALGLNPGSVGVKIAKTGDVVLLEAWRSLPAGGAFASSRSVPRALKFQTQAEADTLMEEATLDAPIEGNQREAVVRLLIAAFSITGTMNLPRGWLRAMLREFEKAGHSKPPTPVSARWYRRMLAKDPETFAEFFDDPELLQDLIDRADPRA